MDAKSGFFGLTRIAMDLAFGTKANSNSNRLATSCVAKKFTPVMLASGRLMLWTKPTFTGSAPLTNTIGISGVSFLRTSAVLDPPPARITDGLS